MGNLRVEFEIIFRLLELLQSLFAVIKDCVRLNSTSVERERVRHRIFLNFCVRLKRTMVMIRTRLGNAMRTILSLSVLLFFL